MFTLKKPIPQITKMEGRVKITLSTGHMLELDEKVFNDNFKPLSSIDPTMELKRKLISIKDLQAELDDDNAEELLLKAIDIATVIMNSL